MKNNRELLALFEEKKSFFEEKVSCGIERYRKGDGSITVLNSSGEAISNAKIKIDQRSHEFRFGANLFMLDELETKEKNDKYKKYFSEVFNIATLPFYWNTLEPERGKPRYDKDSPRIYRRPSIDLCIDFCEEHGIEPREHALAYEHFFPDWLIGAGVDEIKRELERRYSEISERYADKIPTIEVTNEMEWEKGKTAFYDQPDFVEWCFKMAEKYFPQNQLVINDHTRLAWGDCCCVTDKYYSYIEANILKGARVDAIGMQYHLFHKAEDIYEKTRVFLDPEKIYGHMELYSSFGKPLQVTEVTVPAYSWESEDEEIQAEIIEKLYSLWFAHPNVEQIVYWNLVDGYAHGATQGDMTAGENYFYGGLLRFDLSPKPAYLKIKELTKERWHTKASLVTDQNGIVDFRGFFGDYDVEIEIGGIIERRTLSLKKNGENNFTFVI